MDPASLVSQHGQFPDTAWPFPPASGTPGFAGKQRAGRRRRRGSAAAPDDDSSRHVSCSSGGNDSQTDCDVKRHNIKGTGDEIGDSKVEVEAEAILGTCNNPADNNSQPPDAPKQDYIHVRARRGQATDSHSLAERARREKISERMKILQDLVPGCNKVVGKASVLDEIINYIQSLQRQVEFLSMKLEAVNSQMNSGIEDLPSKDFVQQMHDNASNLSLSSRAHYEQGSATEWLHMQVGHAPERVT